MEITYRKLWKLLIDRGMRKGELQKAAGISQSTMAKLGRNKNVNTDILVKLCTALNCSLADIAEVIPDEGARL